MNLLSSLERKSFYILTILIIVVYGVMIKGNIVLPSAFLFIMTVFLCIRYKENLSMKQRGINGHQVFFFIFMFYLLFQSIRGSFFDFRVLFFVMFYGAIIIYTKININIYEQYAPARVDICSLLFYSGSVWFIVYLLQGIVLLFSGRNVYDFQSIYFAGSSYAFFPLVIVLPAAISLFTKKNKETVKKDKYWIIILLLCLISFTGGLFDSRMAFMAFTIFWLCLFIIGDYSKIILIIVAMFVSYNIGIMISGGGFICRDFSIGDLFSRNFRCFRDLSPLIKQTRSITSDFDRLLALKCAWEVIQNNVMTFFVGYGFYSHKIVLIDVANRYNTFYGFVQTSGAGAIRTSLFPAFLVDTGIIGIFLYLGNLIYCAKEIIKNNILFSEIFTIIMFLLLILLWSFTTNISGAVLLYLIIMPHGLLYRIAPPRINNE